MYQPRLLRLLASYLFSHNRVCLQSEDVAETALEERLRMQGSLMCIPTDHSALDVSKEEDTSFLALAHAAICGGLSGTFDKFLGCYVQLERQNLEDMLKRLSMEEDTAEEGAALGGGAHRVCSCMLMFVSDFLICMCSCAWMLSG
jgi:hypothetical protein